MFVVVNALAGALGTALGALLDWDPFPGKWVLNGLIFAAAGQGLLRVEPRGFGLDQANSARSLLVRAQDFAVDFATGKARAAIGAHLRQLKPDQKVKLALRLHAWHIAPAEAVPQESKDLLAQQMVEAGECMSDPDPGKSEDGKATLEAICFKIIEDHALPPEECELS